MLIEENHKMEIEDVSSEMLHEKNLSIDDILRLYTEIIKKYKNYKRLPPNMEKFYCKLLNDYADLLFKKGKLEESTNITIGDDTDSNPIVINVLKSNKIPEIQKKRSTRRKK